MSIVTILSAKEARRLTERIKLTVESIDNSLYKLYNLLDEAQRSNAWQVTHETVARPGRLSNPHTLPTRPPHKEDTPPVQGGASQKGANHHGYQQQDYRSRCR